MTLKDEILNIRKDADKKGIEQSKKILRLYKVQRDAILVELGRLITQYYSDEVFTFSDYERYTALTALEIVINEKIQKINHGQTELTYQVLKEAFKDSYYKTAYTINKGIGFQIDFSLLKDEFVQASIERPINGKDFSKRIWDNTAVLAKRIKSDIQDSIIQGLSPYKISTKVKNDFGVGAYQAKRLVNTELAKTVMSAQDEIYTNMNEVQKVMWDATLESNTCDYCSSLDGHYFDKNNHPVLPAHPNCRCCIIPVVDGWNPTKKREYNTESGKRKSSIINYKTFEDWKDSLK